MTLGRVVGEIHSTINHPFYETRTLLIVEKSKPDGSAAGGYLIAIDTVAAGVGDAVLVLDEGTGARQVLQSTNAPVRSVVVGIVDAVTVEARGMERATGIEPV